MKKKDLEKYVLPLTYFFLLATCLGIWLLGGRFILAMYYAEDFLQYYTLIEITVFELKLLGIIILVITFSAWYALGILVERTFNVHLFPNILVFLENNHRIRMRPNLLKAIAQKKKLPEKPAEHQENE